MQWIPIIFSNMNSDLIWETSRNKLKKHSVSKIVLIFTCLNKLLLYVISDILQI